MKKNEKIIYNAVLNFCNDDETMARELMQNSLLLKYIEKKTASIDKGSTARFSFANLYAIYVLTENYISINASNINYSDYDGMMFSAALARTRSLPFGSKLQNHALNHRCNEEFKKFFPTATLLPIKRDTVTKRYWIESELLNIHLSTGVVDISSLIINIIDSYVLELVQRFEGLLNELKSIRDSFLSTNNQDIIIDFIKRQLQPNVDARTFELVAFVILKYYYKTQTVYIGTSKDNVKPKTLDLYKTGRTNANDGGIDYILKPLGRIFQVTEELNFEKYFLDISKLNHYSITFVIKTSLSKEEVNNRLKIDALSKYSTKDTVNMYLSCFEEIITINELLEFLNIVIENNFIPDLITDLIQQTELEFNLDSNSK